MKDAVEMAVLSHVRHPGIVAVYETFSDMVEDAPSSSASSSATALGTVGGANGAGAGTGASTPPLAAAAAAPPRLPRYRPALPEDDGRPTVNIIVMEFADLGSLRDAVRRGLFHVKIAPGVVAVDLLKVVRVLLDVARAVEYLHERRLLHCDLKLDNVLLKSDVAADTGFACKLADFGLTKLMNDQ